MNWYKIGSIDSDGFMAVEGSLGGTPEWKLREGCRVELMGDIWLRGIPSSEGEPEDVLENHFGVPVFSLRLRKALGEVGLDRGIQYIPIRVYHADGEEIEGFSIANVINLIDAFELPLCCYEVFPDDYFLSARRGRIRYMYLPVLRPAVIEGFDLIRPAGFSVQLYCSERFKSLFEGCNFSGYSFHRVPLVGDDLTHTPGVLQMK